MYGNDMKMKRLFIFCLMGLLFAACSKDEEDVYNNCFEGPNHSVIRYQGIWSIDDEPIEQTFTIVYSNGIGGVLVGFPSFPYQAFTDRVLTEVKVTEIVKQERPFQIQVSMTGNSMYNNYYKADNSILFGGSATYLSYDVLTQDVGKITVRLGLNPANSVFSFNSTAASCILVVDHVDIDYENGEHKTLELSPVRKLTFVSTKRIK